MRVELWVPTATPICTPELLACIGREAEERGFAASGSASTSCCSRSTPRPTPTPTTAGSPPRRARACSSRSHPGLPRRPHLDRPAGDRHGAAAPAQPGLHGQGGGHPGLAVERSGRPRRRRRVAGGGVPGGQRALAAAGPADRRVPRGADHTLDRGDLLLRRRVLLAEAVPDVPEAGPVTRADPHRRRVGRRPAPRGPGRARLAHLQPRARGTGRAAGHPRRVPGRARAGAGRT